MALGTAAQGVLLDPVAPLCVSFRKPSKPPLPPALLQTLRLAPLASPPLTRSCLSLAARAATAVVRGQTGRAETRAGDRGMPWCVCSVAAPSTRLTPAGATLYAGIRFECKLGDSNGNLTTGSHLDWQASTGSECRQQMHAGCTAVHATSAGHALLPPLPC